MPVSLTYHTRGFTLTSNNERLFITNAANALFPNSFKIFTPEGELRGSIHSVLNCYSIVLKDNLKLFASSRTATSQLLFTLQRGISGYYSFTPMTYTWSGANDQAGHASCDDPSSNLIMAASNVRVWQIDTSTGIASTPKTHSTFSSQTIRLIPLGANQFIIPRRSISIPIVRRSDFVVEKFSNFVAGWQDCSYSELDNLDQDTLYLRTISQFIHVVSLSTSSNNSPLTQKRMIDTGGYGYDGPILNFGPYQYVVTIPAFTLQNQVMFIDKTSFSLVFIAKYRLSCGLPNTATSSNIGTGSLSFEGFSIHDRFYFGVVVLANSIGNFQSYYLLVDNCTSLHPDNFPEAHGVNPYSLTIDQCGVGCKECKMDSSKCSLCDTAMNYEIVEHGTCSPALKHGFDSANNNLVVRCADSFCDLCRSNFRYCMECAALTKVSEAGCVPFDRYGFDQSRTAVQPCASEGCMNCTNNYQICTECDTSRGYILSNGACSLNREDLKLLSVQVGRETKSVTFSFLKKLAATFKPADLSYSVYGFTITFAQNLSITDGILTIRNKTEHPIISSDGLSEFQDFPLIAPQLRYLDARSQQLSRTGLLVGMVLGFIGVASLLVLASRSPSAAKTLLKSLASLVCYLLINSGVSTVALPLLFLRQATQRSFVGLLPRDLVTTEKTSSLSTLLSPSI